jgi:hypothetical protein
MKIQSMTVASLALVTVALMATDPGSRAASTADNPSSDDLTPVSSFSGGDQFFLQKSSIKPSSDGRLQYTVIGEPSQAKDSNFTHPVTSNEVDCSTGQYKSAIQTQQLDSQGHPVSQQTGSPYPVTLNKSSQLYKALKDACQAQTPDQKLDW